MSKIILVTGGARSGKSSFAERLALTIGNRAAYIATAQIFDDEMKQRVEMHQRRRGANWTTFEAPFDAHNAIDVAAATADVILFDCITMYISNMICAFDDLDNTDRIYQQINRSIEQLIDAATAFNGTMIFVTNEVGSGIVPINKLARIFRDCQGIANQIVASRADEVYLCVSGIPIEIKSLQYQPIDRNADHKIK